MATSAPKNTGQAWLVAARPTVIDILTRPLSLPKFFMLAAALVGAVTAYCVIYCLIAYTPMHGTMMPVHLSAAWSFSAVVPWVVCFELAKRARFVAGAGQIIAIIASFFLACLLSIPLGLGFAQLLGGTGPLNWPMEIAHLLPRAAVTALLIGVSRTIPQVREHDSATPDASLDAFLDAEQEIEWIKAAGNYVEVRRNGYTRLHRITMQTVEQSLNRSQFVRIHRQVIVNKDFVDCHLRSGANGAVRLKDGTTFRIGGRYGNNWAAADG